MDSKQLLELSNLSIDKYAKNNILDSIVKLEHDYTSQDHSMANDIYHSLTASTIISIFVLKSSSSVQQSVTYKPKTVLSTNY